MALIKEELGQPWQEIYSELSPSPIAAGIVSVILSNNECSRFYFGHSSSHKKVFIFVQICGSISWAGVQG